MRFFGLGLPELMIIGFVALPFIVAFIIMGIVRRNDQKKEMQYGFPEYRQPQQTFVSQSHSSIDYEPSRVMTPAQNQSAAPATQVPTATSMTNKQLNQDVAREWAAAGNKKYSTRYY